jgi:hypothetical protein
MILELSLGHKIEPGNNSSYYSVLYATAYLRYNASLAELDAKKA